MLEQWMGLLGFSVDKGNTQIYSGNKAAFILREQGNEPDFGGSEFGNLENTFGTIRPVRPVQTQISLCIHTSVDDITFMLTILYDGKINI